MKIRSFLSKKNIMRFVTKALRIFVYLGIMAWLVFFYLRPASLAKFTSYFDSDFAAAFWGAVAGSGTIIFVEWFRDKRKALALFNSTQVFLAGHINRLLLIKKQFALPHYYEVDNIKIAHANFINQVKNLPPEVVPVFEMEMKEAGMALNNAELDFLIPLDSLGEYAGAHPQALLLAMKTKEALNTLQVSIAYKNQIVMEMSADTTSTSEKLLRYLGLRKLEGSTDDRLFTACLGVLEGVDTALFFAQKTIDAVNKMAHKELPFWLVWRVASMELTDQDYKDLMPADDHIKGW